ncbi:uncharacterized protein LOC130601288 [Pezoporus wallicus]|uniref:uncharacterized protein LOC130601288 n=1 Tax=Pezoporus wallicus TaxID=35540 RepID=UPI00254FC3CF|nr:uncharacterized protein LOC130601288 [Pezoporus wallicus]XP_061316897.1 uncharacterized protein LOC133273033 [Pezoporus flaviventris]
MTGRAGPGSSAELTARFLPQDEKARAPPRDDLSRSLRVSTRSRLHLALTAKKNIQQRAGAFSRTQKVLAISSAGRQNGSTATRRPQYSPPTSRRSARAAPGLTEPRPLPLIGSQLPASGKSQWRAPPCPCLREGAGRLDRTTCRPRGGVGSPPSRWRGEAAAHGPVRESGGGAPGPSAG